MTLRMRRMHRLTVTRVMDALVSYPPLPNPTPPRVRATSYRETKSITYGTPAHASVVFDGVRTHLVFILACVQPACRVVARRGRLFFFAPPSHTTHYRDLGGPSDPRYVPVPSRSAVR